MAYNGSGVFTPVYNWQTDKANGIKIRADRMDGQDSDIATGLTTAICKDGQTTITANLPMATFRHTGVGNASARTDYLAAGQMQDQALTYFTAGGTIDAYTLTPSPAITALAAGLTFFVRIPDSKTSTSTTPTLNVSGLGAATIANGDLTALTAGQLVAGGVYQMTYQGTAGFLLPNAAASTPFGLTDAGVSTSAGTITDDSYQMFYPPTAGMNLLFPSTTQGKFVMLIKLGPYALKMYGTINGTYQTITIFDEQTFIMTYSTARGWV